MTAADHAFIWTRALVLGTLVFLALLRAFTAVPKDKKRRGLDAANRSGR